MFNVKSVKKFVVVSASALMLISAGGGAVNAMHTNVNADAFSEFDSSHPLNQLSASDKRQDADEAYNAYEDSIQHPEDAKANLEDEADNPYFKNNATYQSGVKNVIKRAKGRATAKKVARHSHKVNKHAKINRNNKIKKQIANLKKIQSNLKHRISKATGRKYRTRRAKRNAKRYVNCLANRYIRNNKKLYRLNRKLKANAKKVVRRHNIRRHGRKYIKKSKRGNN